jgi:hypothetical protein
MLYFDYSFSITEKCIKFEDSHPDERLRSDHVKPGDLYRVELDQEGRIMLVKLDPVYDLVLDA